MRCSPPPPPPPPQPTRVLRLLVPPVDRAEVVHASLFGSQVSVRGPILKLQAAAKGWSALHACKAPMHQPHRMQVMQRGIVDEMAQLLVLVSREEGDKFRRAHEHSAVPSGLPAIALADGTATDTAAAADGSAAGSTAAALDSQAAQPTADAAAQMPPDSQDGTAPPGKHVNAGCVAQHEWPHPVMHHQIAG